VAGDDQGLAGEGVNQLNTPYDIAFDSTNQYLYVADHENARIQRFSVTGDDNRTGVTVFKFDDATA
jgi:DNA-binding beta-propeller fold protein YncE